MYHYGPSIAAIALPIIIVVVIIALFSLFPLGLWFSALMSGVHINIFNLVGMKFRRVSPRRIVPPMIKARKAGINVTMNELETLYRRQRGPRGGRADRGAVGADRAGL